ncbi:MAG: CRISPR-associated protein Cas5 [Synergistaceae bacterium]|nr:CRISPR-associated protein Cas5 [Synergistaceae bacterium]
MEIAGDTAMWTRPDTGDSPVSYPAPTYSAVKAIFKSVLWGPAIEVIPVKAEICAPVQFHTYYTNYGGPLRKTQNIESGNSYQLCATVLIDVCYRLYARVVPYWEKDRLPQKAREWDEATTSPGHAYQAIFNRRVKRGQCYSVPSLGWREFTPSYFGEFREETCVCCDMPTIIIPSMLRHVFPDGYGSELSYRYDTDVKIEGGVLIYHKGKPAC